MSLNTKSYIFGPRNEIDSMSYMTEFTLWSLLRVYFCEGCMDRRWQQKFPAKWVQEDGSRHCKFL